MCGCDEFIGSIASKLSQQDATSNYAHGYPNCNLVGPHTSPIAHPKAEEAIEVKRPEKNAIGWCSDLSYRASDADAYMDHLEQQVRELRKLAENVLKFDSCENGCNSDRCPHSKLREYLEK